MTNLGQYEAVANSRDLEAATKMGSAYAGAAATKIGAYFAEASIKVGLYISFRTG